MFKQEDKYYYKNSQLGEKFLQLPWFLLKSEYYRTLSSDAKLAYALLKDRFEDSYENNWVDDEDRIYFIFTNTELEHVLNLKKNKVVNVKKELTSYGLLEVVKRGFNHITGKNDASRLYLLKPDLQATDFYKKAEKGSSALQPHGSLKSKLPDEGSSALQPHGSLKSKLPKKETSALQPHGSLKSKPDLKEDYNYKDTNEILKDTRHRQNETHVKETIPSFDVFSKETNFWLNQIAKSSDISAAELKMVIFKAKNKALKDNSFAITTVLDLKDYQNFITTTIKGLVKAMKTDNGVKNVKGYLYQSIYKGFDKYAKLYVFAHAEGLLDYDSHDVQSDLDSIYRDLDGSTLLNIGVIQHNQHNFKKRS